MDMQLGIMLRPRTPYWITTFKLWELKNQLQELRTQQIISLNILSSVTTVPCHEGVW